VIHNKFSVSWLKLQAANLFLNSFLKLKCLIFYNLIYFYSHYIHHQRKWQVPLKLRMQWYEYFNDFHDWTAAKICWVFRFSRWQVWRWLPAVILLHRPVDGGTNTSETAVNLCQTTWCNIPKLSHLRKEHIATKENKFT
jgi:hypothetical protein